MPELVYQTWERITGRPWSDAAKGGFTDGSYDANVALQKRLLGGWDPYAKAAKKAPAKKAPTAKAPAPTGPSVPMQIEPGAWLNLQEEAMELERQWREAADAREAERIENQAREMELRLSMSPIDYVAYQSYIREREAAGKPVYGAPPATDVGMQEMIATMVGEGGGSLGVGEFDVEIPRTEAISRAESLTYSPAEMDILGSFLRAGFQANGQEVSYDPVDYWREVEEGFIPTIRTPAATRYSF